MTGPTLRMKKKLEYPPPLDMNKSAELSTEYLECIPTAIVFVCLLLFFTFF